VKTALSVKCCMFWHRARLKLLLEMSAEDPMAIVESIGTQIMQEDVLPLTSRDFAAMVDQVTTDDVNEVNFDLFITDCII